MLVRLHPELLSGLDAMAAVQTDAPGRPEAIRRVLSWWLGVFGSVASPAPVAVAGIAGAVMDPAVGSASLATLVMRAATKFGEAETARILERALAENELVAPPLKEKPKPTSAAFEASLNSPSSFEGMAERARADLEARFAGLRREAAEQKQREAEEAGRAKAKGEN